MIRSIQLSGLLIKADFIIPDKILQFLKKNNIDFKDIINFPDWNQYIAEDFQEPEEKGKLNIENGNLNVKIIINYIHITKDNQVFVKAEEATSAKLLASSSLDKGTILEGVSMGYKIYQ